MKILEVKNNLVKISYTAKDDLILSGFVIIEDSKNPYVAQVMSLKADGGMNYAIVKLLFTFNEEGVVKNYNGSIPEISANITRLTSDELLDILPVENPLTIGKLAQQKFILDVDYSILDKHLLICSDNNENTDILISNIAKQITDNNNKSVIFDTTGTINAENKLVFGKDFKLPLNYDTINFIYEHDLSDIDPNSKAVIQDILLEVQEYSKTVLDRFVPFDSLITVVEAQYRQLKLPELALLKNRLLKYKEDNAFAQEAREIHMLRGSIRANLSTLLDISAADSVLQNLIISTVYNEIDDLDLYLYSLVKVDNDNADKKLLKKFIANDKISTIVTCSHNFKYLYDLKEFADNLILYTPQTLQHDFGSYNVFLNKLNPDEFIMYGKATQYIPLIIENMPIEEIREFQNEFKADAEVKTSDNTQNETEETSEIDETDNTYSQESMMKDSAVSDDEFEEISKEETTSSEEKEEEVENAAEADYENTNSDEPLDESEIQEETSASEDEFYSEEEETEQNKDESLEPLEEYNEESDEVTDEEEYNSIEQVKNEDILEPIEEPQEEEFIDLPDDNESIEEDTIVEESEEETPNIDDIDEFSEQEDEDMISEEEFVEDSEAETQIEQSEGLTEEDLDYIDNINEQDKEENSEEIPEAESYTEDDINEEPVNTGESDIFPTDFEQQDTEDQNTPVVPVYPVEEETPVNGYQNEFEAGDRVSHPKHGEGVVEKMVKFGNKVLCSVSFASGRKLLDPTISQLQKI